MFIKRHDNCVQFNFCKQTRASVFLCDRSLYPTKKAHKKKEAKAGKLGAKYFIAWGTLNVVRNGKHDDGKIG